MLNDMMRVLIERNFSVHIYSSLGYGEQNGRLSVIITHMIKDKSAIGYDDCPEKALAKAMLNYIEGHGRIE
ncbi:hypothetical protein PQE71_gp231 [Bacillus phage Izhevsk]|uniref:Uncharacterized protein n=2 Tax=Tsamsavirus TaxID=3044849 RepID=A0A6H0X6I7_9CAUD|nr:hypothetical protein X915_gp251 [Bacillus phage vB_BanS-Tsamsa]YP_010680657.1 hypothetical protein PQE71_gp231 [Bacillus phage Izhevsk]AGI11931.1 hypothetical protein [Bacillus phage vB_BanS-Tsamsa]QIW89934.1 hypothetical protein Izhevsk_253 [Bacillus phage Izhevsk]UUV46662.1 hypothetical protein [Bacillus phage vB_BanS-Thrax4]